MITPSAIFSTALANRARTPIYRVVIDGVTTEYATHAIKANYDDVVIALSPVGYWRFGEPSGTTAVDSSGNSRNGTYQNTPTLGVTGALTKDADTAVTFASASSEYVDMTTVAGLNLRTALTLECWFKTTSDGALITRGGSHAGSDMQFALVVESGKAKLYLAKADSTFATVASTTTVTDGVWRHVAATWNGTTLVLYLNGVSEGTPSGTLSGTLRDSATAFNVARWGDATGYLNGSIDEPAAFSSALTATQIRSIYDAGLMLYNRTGVSRCLQLPRGIASQLRQDTGIPSVGGFSVVLQDRSGAITTLISEGIGGKLITLSAGFNDIREDDYQTILTGLISDYQLTSDLAGYELKIQDPQTFLNDTVCETAATTLNGSITNADATITADDTQFFRSSGTRYFRIEEEWISYTGGSGTTFTTCTRGLFGSTAAAHPDGAVVSEMIRLTGHPIDIAIALCTDTDKAGLSMDASLVDSTALAALKASIGSSYSMDFRILERFNALEFIAKELLAPISCRPVITNAGQFSAVEFAEPEDVDSVGAITDDVICKDRNGRPGIGWGGNLPYLFNAVNYNYDVDEIKDQFATHFEDQDDLSIDTYGEYPYSADSRGLRAALSGTQTLIEDRSLALLQRYANGAPLVNVRTFLSKLTIEPGDIISLTTAFLPNRSTGARGITAGLFEVLERRVAFDQGFIDFILLYTGFASLTSDDFDRADTDSDTSPDLDGEWNCNTQSLITPSVSSNQLYLGADGPSDGRNLMWRTDSGFTTNQISELEFVSEAGGASGPAIRIVDRAVANCSCYAAIYNPATPAVQLRKFLGQAIYAGGGLVGGTQLGSNYSVTLSVGDRLRIYGNGTELFVYLNGDRIIGPITDTAIQSAGAPGALHALTTGTHRWDRWRGGNGLI